MIRPEPSSAAPLSFRFTSPYCSTDRSPFFPLRDETQRGFTPSCTTLARGLGGFSGIIHRFSRENRSLATSLGRNPPGYTSNMLRLIFACFAENRRSNRHLTGENGVRNSRVLRPISSVADRPDSHPKAISSPERSRSEGQNTPQRARCGSRSGCISPSK